MIDSLKKEILIEVAQIASKKYNLKEDIIEDINKINRKLRVIELVIHELIIQRDEVLPSVEMIIKNNTEIGELVKYYKDSGF